MPAEPTSTRDSVIEVNLRRPDVAAFWAWFWPGAGHLYQRRYAKGMLFMVCILSTYFYGLALGGGHSVYASFRENDRRWQYICQVGVGLPALPALVQSYRVFNNKPPLYGDIMAPPREVSPDNLDKLAIWHQRYPFEMATLYTMVAGLLNVLAIYDAYAGPMTAPPEEEKKKKRPPPKDEPAAKKPPD
jgi:hypothetical protein